MRNRLDHVVKSLPYLSPQESNTVHYAGHLPADKAGDHQLFYWLFSPSLVNATNDAPLIIWLNGGPGYSSLVGLFLENGPFRLINRTAIQTNAHSWHTAPAWTLYVDQPVGTGLSVTNNAKQKYCTNDDCICANFHYFLRQFLWLHRDDMLVKNRSRECLYTVEATILCRRILCWSLYSNHCGLYFTTKPKSKRYKREWDSSDNTRGHCWCRHWKWIHGSSIHNGTML